LFVVIAVVIKGAMIANAIPSVIAAV